MIQISERPTKKGKKMGKKLWDKKKSEELKRVEKIARIRIFAFLFHINFVHKTTLKKPVRDREEMTASYRNSYKLFFLHHSTKGTFFFPFKDLQRISSRLMRRARFII